MDRFDSLQSVHRAIDLLSDARPALPVGDARRTRRMSRARPRWSAAGERNKVLQHRIGHRAAEVSDFSFE